MKLAALLMPLSLSLVLAPGLALAGSNTEAAVGGALGLSLIHI